jgi:hypothetical protein
MTDPADLLAQAAETRRLADAATNDTIRWQLVGLAKRFERLADQLDVGRRSLADAADKRSDDLQSPEVGSAAAFMLGVG